MCESVDMSSDVHTTASLQLRHVNQRLTSSRAALLDVLAGAKRPMTIAEILEANKGFAQSSVYRNLMVLEQAAVVRRILTSDEYARYELAENHTGHHHHLVCSNCGAVEDIPSSPRLEKAVDQLVSEVHNTAGFKTVQHRVDLVGLCSNCA